MNPTSLLDVLRDAAASLQAGQPHRARELLSGLIRARPDSVEAHRLLASALMQTGEFVRAHKELRTCLRLRPDDADTQLMLARVLSTSGRGDEAIRVLRETLRSHPVHTATVCALAHLLLTQSRPQEALQVLQPFAGSGRESPEFWMLHGHALTSLGRAGDAVASFRAWLQMDPGNPSARLRLAGALVDSGDSVEAETLARVAKVRMGHSSDAAFILGLALMGQGRFEEAEAELREAVHAKPGHVMAQSNLADLAWMRTGDAKAATAEIDAALVGQPRSDVLRIIKARLLLSAGDAKSAMAEVEAGLNLAPDDSGLLKMAATVALDFDGPCALGYAQRAVQTAPDNRLAQVVFGKASLAVGHASEALQVAEALHRQNPNDGQALALKADALRMLGDPAYRELLDYGNFVRAYRIDAPPGWEDLPSYLVDLAGALTRAHTFTAHPIGNSLRRGSQVVLRPERSGDHAIRAFPQAIDGAIRAYMGALGRGKDPMRCRNSGAYGLKGMWSVRLRPNGFHVNHYHPEGWISSAFYLQLPPAVEDRGGEGWLKFGEPGFPTTPALGPEYFLKPEPGLLALFPSYMWHGTVPFSGAPTDRRLTIAFDVVPAST